jgi:hypothetical protein
MRPRKRHLVPGVCGLTGAALLCACSAGTVAGAGPATTGSSSRTGPAATASATTDPVPAQPGATYVAAIEAVVAQGARVWVEADLVKRWLQGRAAFESALNVVVALAGLPGVDGVKIADELGYHDGLKDPAAAQAFLDAASRGIRERRPNTKILIDVVIPELGCLPGSSGLGVWPGLCAARQRQADPTATLSAVDGYLRSGDIDVIDISAGLRPDTEYQNVGVSRDDAMRLAWAEIERRGWAKLVRLQARKALAHPGAYAGDAASAERDLHTFVDIPLSMGAQAVDVWTWRQTYQGQIVRLMNPGLVDNPLWDGLRLRRQGGEKLWTHMTPSSLEIGLSRDVTEMTQVMSAVFVAAGTG